MVQMLQHNSQIFFTNYLAQLNIQSKHQLVLHVIAKKPLMLCSRKKMF